MLARILYTAAEFATPRAAQRASIIFSPRRLSIPLLTREIFFFFRPTGSYNTANFEILTQQFFLSFPPRTFRRISLQFRMQSADWMFRHTNIYTHPYNTCVQMRSRILHRLSPSPPPPVTLWHVCFQIRKHKHLEALLIFYRKSSHNLFFTCDYCFLSVASIVF